MRRNRGACEKHMKLLATHITRYWYSGPVSMCHTEVHLQPRPRENQTILEFGLEVTPTPDSLLSREDYFGNEVTFFSIAEPHRELIITSRCLANLEACHSARPRPIAPLGAGAGGISKRDTPEAFEAGQFVFESPSIQVGAPFANLRRRFFYRGPSVAQRGRRSVAPHFH